MCYQSHAPPGRRSHSGRAAHPRRRGSTGACCLAHQMSCSSGAPLHVCCRSFKVDALQELTLAPQDCSNYRTGVSHRQTPQVTCPAGPHPALEIAECSLDQTPSILDHLKTPTINSKAFSNQGQAHPNDIQQQRFSPAQCRDTRQARCAHHRDRECPILQHFPARQCKHRASVQAVQQIDSCSAE